MNNVIKGIMAEFKVNEYLSLRLEDEETVICVSRARFMQCSFLLLNIDVDEMSTFDEIESIDEAAEKLDASMEDPVDAYKFKIPPEVEFWGHCSNLQVWYEHDYDTRLLHSNLAFPLLRRLTEAGDPLAKKVFKKEIIKRYKNGTEKTREFLIIEGFLRYLTLDERLHLILSNDDFTVLIELSEEIPAFEEDGVLIDSPIIEFLSSCIDNENIKINEHGHIIELTLWNLKLQIFPRSILKLKFLRKLNLRNNKLKEIPQDIDKLKNLKDLSLSNNKMANLPDSVCNMKNLEVIRFDENELERLPNNIGDLSNLKILQLSNNRLRELPESICELKNLEELSLGKNLLKKLPKCLACLISLTYINLRKNPFIKYPEILKKIKNLKEIRID
jgi:hypothetical protein